MPTTVNVCVIESYAYVCKCVCIGSDHEWTCNAGNQVLNIQETGKYTWRKLFYKLVGMSIELSVS